MEIALITSFTILLKIAYNHPQPPIVTHIHSCFDLNTICEMCVILLIFNTYLLWWILMYPSIFVPLYLPLMRCKKTIRKYTFRCLSLEKLKSNCQMKVLEIEKKVKDWIDTEKLQMEWEIWTDVFFYKYNKVLRFLYYESCFSFWFFYICFYFFNKYC